MSNRSTWGVDSAGRLAEPRRHTLRAAALRRTLVGPLPDELRAELVAQEVLAAAAVEEWQRFVTGPQ